MEQVIAGIPSVACYLDDIIVTGKNDTEHLKNFEQVLERLRQFGFTLKKEKCAFMQHQVEYLGHVVTAEGFGPSAKKVSAILNMPPPTQVSELRAFLGMIQHFAKYLPSLADACAPLNNLLRKSVPWQWSASCVDAFEAIKKMLTSAQILTHYDPRKEIFLAVDASSKGLGAVIYHRINGHYRPIAPASKALTPAETKYAQIEREALAIIFGVKKFHQYLWGRRFTLFTDHKPLTAIFGSKKGIPVTTASRLQRWAIILMSYSFDIQFKSTNNIANADGLSRLPEGPDLTFDEQMQRGIFNVEDEEINAVHDFHMSTLPVTAKHTADATQKDHCLAQVLEFIVNGWPKNPEPQFAIYFQKRTELSSHSGCVLWGLRTVIPEKYRADLLDTLHDCHVGQTKMKMLARSYLWWPGLDKDIEARVRRCDQCASVAAQESPVPLHQWESPEKPWCRLHADFAELHGNHYFVLVDAFSKWPEVVRMVSTTAIKTIEVLKDIFLHNGLPEVLVSDNGPPFTSQLFERFLSEQGIHHVRTPPYHPKSNGQAENFVRTLKAALSRSSVEDREVLRSFVFKYRVTPHASTGRPPCELLNNRHYRSVLDLVRPAGPSASPPARDVAAKERQKRCHDKRAPDRSFGSNTCVWMHDPHKKGHWSSATIVGQEGKVIFRVRDADGKMHRVHKDHLKQRGSLQSWEDELPRASPASCLSADCLLPFPEVDDTFTSCGDNQTSTEPSPVRRPTSAPGNEATGPDSSVRRYPLRDRHPVDRYGSI
ncbi:uncharacterized protein K02A2.6-like [Ornithodoros turicata]|uniref:uncharacterized protein K02A2.6-like n=1 Tax=Ornithodoros turicata TaxID=34597 RepID=UPI0031397164